MRGALATVRHRGHALPASQQQELLGIAHRQAEQMQRLVDQLLVAAALERPRPSPPDGRWSTPALWPRRPPGPPGWPIPASRSPSRLLGRWPLLVSADSTAISRILGNLLDNATSHSPPAALIRLTVARDGQQAVLAVLDHGSGFPPTSASASSSAMRGWRSPPASPPAAWGWACTSLGGWPGPTAAGSRPPTRRMAVGPALSYACPWRHIHPMSGQQPQIADPSTTRPGSGLVDSLLG